VRKQSAGSLAGVAFFIKYLTNMTKFLCVGLFFFTLTSNAQYRNLVFQGGGVRGIAYAGAVQVLEQKNIIPQIENIGGTSAGSIIGLMLCLGYSSSEIYTIMIDLNIQHFNDGAGGIFGKYERTKKKFGLHKGDTFADWLENLVKQKTGIPLLNFYQLDSLRKTNSSFKSFYCVGTNLTKQRAEIFSLATTPNMPIKTAVRISSSIPFFYEPILLDSSGKEPVDPIKDYPYQVYVDGGITQNYPIDLFDSCVSGDVPLFCDNIIYNPHTLGFKLEREAQVNKYKTSTELAPYNIKSIKQYTDAFISFSLHSLNNKPGLENEKGRTVYISYGDISAKPRKLSKKEKDILFNNGKEATEDFFK
jgi:NTE family protein